jgi:hypothetical protein
VFARCKSPPSVAVRGLMGAYFESASANLLGPNLPFPPFDCDRPGALAGGKGGKGESKFEESGSGDGGRRCTGLRVTLRMGFPNGD